ncbi:MAG: bifunctional phosphoribosyl-AMP cyclohydrolase/phosphoribosyl-ATP diphosphatase HisIE [Saprospiraceae bacterium]|nr:bifunctional phosphoribosyl-AMP cyclohydrolase/phosphoribosyl-ATP diphosphatase HisIE [Saprospiraceae bacterium]
MKLTNENIAEAEVRFDADGLVPAIVQNHLTGEVLMQGYMNEEALQLTLTSGKVTFFSRSRQQLWVKGETSNNWLFAQDAFLDCDRDSLLILADPAGPTCHTGSRTCFGDLDPLPFLTYLQELIHGRKNADPKSSYTASLFAKGRDKVAQKVGEEAVELVIEAKNDDAEKFLGEAADLMYHYLVLLTEKGHDLKEVVEVLRERHR